MYVFNILLNDIYASDYFSRFFMLALLDLGPELETVDLNILLYKEFLALI